MKILRRLLVISWISLIMKSSKVVYLRIFFLFNQVLVILLMLLLVDLLPVSLNIFKVSDLCLICV